MGIVILLLCSLAFIYSVNIASVASQSPPDVVCYTCNGNADLNRGNCCNIHNVCVGKSCFFNADVGGSWSSGCSNAFSQSSPALQCSFDPYSMTAACLCTSNFCNSVPAALSIFDSYAVSLILLWNATFDLVRPGNLVATCYECGTIRPSFEFGELVIPCDSDHTCLASQCIRFSGASELYPISFCGTEWSLPVVRAECDNDPTCRMRECSGDLCNPVQAVGSDDVVCYMCNGDPSVNSGNCCNIHNVCTGKSCVFNANVDGRWSSGCSEVPSTSAALQCAFFREHMSAQCSCSSNFCNSVPAALSVFDGYADVLRMLWNATFDLIRPGGLNVTCFECGTIRPSLGYGTITIPCDESHTCLASKCITLIAASEPYPISFCGTEWSLPVVEAECSADPTCQMQQCTTDLCNSDLFNFTTSLATTTISPTTSTWWTLPTSSWYTTSSWWTLSTTNQWWTVTTTTPWLTTTFRPVLSTTTSTCESYGSNPLVVSVAENLKAILIWTFGADSKFVQDMSEQIDKTICNYSF